jgi:hypothetical protein
MSDFNDFNSMALDASYEVLGEPVQYKGGDILAIVSDVTMTEELMDGGIMQKRGIKVVIKDTISVIPEIGEKLFYQAKAYRVLEVSKDNLAYELTCETDAK